MTEHHSSSVSAIPLVVQVGFGGSRMLFDPALHPGIDAERFESDAVHALAERLLRLRAELNLTDRHFLCGISQIAIGADTVFTRACQALAMPQWVLLPQQRDDYLAAASSSGVPDFSAEQSNAAQALLGSPHIIHELVVSNAASRTERLEDTNFEIARLSDLLVCLVRESADARPGGTQDLVAQAHKRNIPVLELTVGVRDGLPVLTEIWHRRNEFSAPTLPGGLSGIRMAMPAPHELPDSHSYASEIKTQASTRAKERTRLFKNSAFVIVGTHIAATACAAGALAFHHPWALPALLVVELGLLLYGLRIHHLLHRADASHAWALSRLVAEVARSVALVHRVPVYLEYLFTLPFPDEIRPLLRTLNVLHLRSSRGALASPWEKARDDYVRLRFLGQDGQLAFYGREARFARRWLRRARRVFMAFSIGALSVSALKLAINLPHGPQETMSESMPWIDDLLHPLGASFGVLAILLPLFAVAALSWAAAFDLDARANTFADALRFLKKQKRFLDLAASPREFATTVLETEHRLLGEIVNWFSRRSFTGVT